jgi:hypothetical protein
MPAWRRRGWPGSVPGRIATLLAAESPDCATESPCAAKGSHPGRRRGPQRRGGGPQAVAAARRGENVSIDRPRLQQGGARAADIPTAGREARSQPAGQRKKGIRGSVDRPGQQEWRAAFRSSGLARGRWPAHRARHGVGAGGRSGLSPRAGDEEDPATSPTPGKSSGHRPTRGPRGRGGGCSRGSRAREVNQTDLLGGPNTPEDRHPARKRRPRVRGEVFCVCKPPAEAPFRASGG